MRILFMTDKDCAPQNGGIERVTSVLSNGFSREGMACFLLFAGEPFISGEGAFEAKYQLDRNNAYSQIRSVVEQEKIDVLFSHFMTKSNRYVVLPAINQLKKDFPNIKHVVLYHSQPGVELMTFPLAVYMRRILKGVRVKENFAYMVKQMMLRLVGEKNYKSFIIPKCRLLYDSSDILVVLNEAYIQSYESLIDVSCRERFRSIGNPLPYDDVLDPGIEKKSKTFLVVSRMEEETKRLSKVLKYWKQVQDVDETWNLEIVGDGMDKKVYESMARELKLRRVSFWGQQQPRSFYEKSFIFLMTSDTEGWPMALLEAMQFGCVPIVFNSFASASTIVSHSVDGILVPPCDDASYVDSMIRLMTDDSMRNRMAYAAVRDCQKFSVEKTVKKWIELFNELVPEKNA